MSSKDRGSTNEGKSPSVNWKWSFNSTVKLIRNMRDYQLLWKPNLCENPKYNRVFNFAKYRLERTMKRPWIDIRCRLAQLRLDYRTKKTAYLYFDEMSKSVPFDDLILTRADFNRSQSKDSNTTKIDQLHKQLKIKMEHLEQAIDLTEPDLTAAEIKTEGLQNTDPIEQSIRANNDGAHVAANISRQRQATASIYDSRIYGNGIATGNRRTETLTQNLIVAPNLTEQLETIEFRLRQIVQHRGENVANVIASKTIEFICTCEKELAKQ